eukprot:28434-Eustigmatos_ZCMA.PRE.1
MDLTETGMCVCVQPAPTPAATTNVYGTVRTMHGCQVVDGSCTSVMVHHARVAAPGLFRRL